MCIIITHMIIWLSAWCIYIYMYTGYQPSICGYQPNCNIYIVINLVYASQPGVHGYQPSIYVYQPNHE